MTITLPSETSATAAGARLTGLRLAAALLEAARQHAAAADAHALAVEMHYEARELGEDTDLNLQEDAQNACADAATQTDTAAEATAATGMTLSAVRDAGREAGESVRQAEGGEDPRGAHAAAAKHHAAAAKRHARAANVAAPGSVEAEEAHAEAESAAVRAQDAKAVQRESATLCKTWKRSLSAVERQPEQPSLTEFHRQKTG